jgi:hypothetical protein
VNEGRPDFSACNRTPEITKKRAKLVRIKKAVALLESASKALLEYADEDLHNMFATQDWEHFAYLLQDDLSLFRREAFGLAKDILEDKGCGENAAGQTPAAHKETV